VDYLLLSVSKKEFKQETQLLLW